MVADQLVFKQDQTGRTIVSIRPHFDEDREFAATQLAHQERFQEATAYAKDTIQTETIYAERVEGTTKNAYNVAVVDWFHPPEVDEIDLDGYTGEVGEVIRVKVSDDLQVEAASMVITTDADVLVKQG